MNKQKIISQLSTLKIFFIFLKLGLISFGGPIAHLGYFREEFVRKLKWLSDHAYADLVALCQFLPGPASSQVGMALGLAKGGVRGAVAAWLGFTLPSAVIMILFGIVFSDMNNSNMPWLHGLKIVAVAVVAQALWGMGRSLCPDKGRASLAIVSCIGTSLIPSAMGQLAMIIIGGAWGFIFFSPIKELPHSELQVQLKKHTSFFVLSAFFILLAVSPLLAYYTHNYLLHLFSVFYRVGSLVFGGGHVVLPLLQAEVIPNGWVSNSTFLAGYGAAQAIPGPLFTFSAFLGAVSTHTPNGWIGGGVALIGIFLPSFLLIIGILPLWENIRKQPSMQRAIAGVNASVVGFLLAAFYNPIWSTTILSLHDYLLALLAFLLLEFWQIPVWIIVIMCAVVAGMSWY